MENNYSHNNVRLHSRHVHYRQHCVYVNAFGSTCVPVLLMVVLLVFLHSMLWDTIKTAIMSHIA
jgi:hypothetical protein